MDAKRVNANLGSAKKFTARCLVQMDTRKILIGATLVNAVPGYVRNHIALFPVRTDTRRTNTNVKPVSAIEVEQEVGENVQLILILILHA